MSASWFVPGIRGASPLVPPARRQGRDVWRLLGTRVVHCPEAAGPAGVTISLRALARTMWRGIPSYRVGSCSRWPAQRGCAQGCLPQIEQAPDDSLPRVLLARWFAGRSCALCAEPLGRPHRFGEQPCVIRPDGRTVRWGDLRAEQVPEVLATCQPVCRTCHIAATFARVLKGGADRPWNRYAARARARRGALARMQTGLPRGPARAGAPGPEEHIAP